ncbi:GNAT family N-acetyltransferase [Nonomuraea terrae]|uniref:GNAT family N-acetyltransferase n=1 Tax=Nonomuraea terrae TaxID=2530383 RepID=UPI003797875D
MHRISRPRPDDAAAIHELVAAYDTAVVGAPDLTLDDVADELAAPGFDPDKDGWLAYGEDGRLDGWARTLAVGDSDLVEAEVVVRPGAEGPAGDLWGRVLGRARELAAERGHDCVTVHIDVYATDDAKRAMAAEHGFEPGTSFHRMRIDHHGAALPPEPPAGLTVDSGDDEDVRREGYRVHQEGFADHFGFVPTTYEQWHARRQAMSKNDWSQLTLARIDGRPAGVIIGNDQFADDEKCGYVAALAVLPDFRGRGLGRFLLRHAFAADAARGRRGTILHVDSANATPAVGLYESAGMRRVLSIDVWQRRI